MSAPRPRSIRFLLTALVLAVGVPLAGATVYFGYRAHASEEARAQDRLIGLADAAATGIQQFLRYTEDVLRGLASDPHVVALRSEECGAHFPEIRYQLPPAFLNVDLWSTDGTLLCTTLLEGDPAFNLAGSGSFDRALASDTFRVSPVFQEQRTGRWSLAASYPVVGPGGERGMLSAVVDLVGFEEILVGVALEEGVLLTVTQANGVVVARSSSPEGFVGRESPSTDAESSDPFTAPFGTSRARTFEGEDYSFGFVQVPEVAWTVYAGLPTERVLGSVWEQAIQLALVGTLVTLLAGLAGWTVHRRIRDPLEGLVEGIGNAELGSLTPLPTDGPAEIAWVAQRFNRAWAALNRAREEQERVDARLRSVVENAVTGIYIATQGGRFLEVNQAMADLLGYPTREALLAAPVEAMYGSEAARQVLLEWGRDRESFQGLPVRWIRLDGTPMDVRLSGRRHLLDDGEVAWEVIVEDVTELTRLQEQVAQSQKMEALGRLAGGIAHDFNNILTVVQGQAELLRGEPGLDAESKAMAGEIVEAADRAAALNRQLLAFGRGSPGDPRAVELDEVVRGMELVLRRAVGEKVTVELELAGGPVVADRSQLEQVLLNLVVNAGDAMSGGGRLSLRTFCLPVSGGDMARYPDARPGEHVVLEVSDTGTGIPDDVLPHIFEPFFSTKDEAKGTGLGLATVYGIVTGAGGHLRVHSAPGEGTSIQVCIPLHPGPVAGTRKARSPQPLATEHTGRVLLVEDEDGVRRYVRRVLEGAGFQVTEAASGTEALQVAEVGELPWDLLVSDVVMPGLGGGEVAARLAALGLVRRALLMSGYPEGLPADGPGGVERWAFLPKPFAPGTFLQAVKDLLDDG